MYLSFHSLRHCVLVAALSACASLVMTQSSLASIIVYTTTMNGASESPANASPGTGAATVSYDNVLNTLRIQANFSGLTGTTTAAHIHAATALPFTSTAGVATGFWSGFPLTVNAGTMDTTFDLSATATFNAPFITANGGTATSATTALVSAMDTGRAYFNIHSTTFGGGEIRGFLVAVPEPSSMILSGLAVIGLAVGYRRKRKAAAEKSIS